MVLTDIKDSSQFREVGVLTKEEIKDHNLVDPCKDTLLQPASYDLRLGSEILFLGKRGSSGITDIRASGDRIHIDSFESILFSTVEIIRLPNNIVGRFDLKIRKALRGLVLQVGPQVEPGYRGRLFGLIINTSGVPFPMQFEDDFLTIEFSYTSKPAVDIPPFDEMLKLKDFIALHLQDTYLTTPNIVENLQQDLKDCQVRHDLSDKTRTKKREWKFSKMLITIGVIGLIFALVLIVLNDNFRKIAGDGFTKMINVVKNQSSPGGELPAIKDNEEQHKE